MNFNNKIEVQKHLPQDLLPKVTMLLQDPGYVTISSRELTRYKRAYGASLYPAYKNKSIF